MLAVSSHEKKVPPHLFTWINQNRSRGWSEGWTGNVHIRSSFIRAARRVRDSGHVCLTWTGCSCSELRLVMLQHRFHTAFLEGAIQKTLGSFVQYVHTCLWVCSDRHSHSSSRFPACLTSCCVSRVRTEVDRCNTSTVQCKHQWTLLVLALKMKENRDWSCLY